jgi:hypothetical protein
VASGRRLSDLSRRHVQACLTSLRGPTKRQISRSNPVLNDADGPGWETGRRCNRHHLPAILHLVRSEQLLLSVEPHSLASQSSQPAFCWNWKSTVFLRTWPVPSWTYKRTNRFEYLVLFFPYLLAVALTCQRFLHAFLFTRLQVKRMTLNFLDDVFCLHLSLKTAQGILKGFAFLDSNLCQGEYTSKPA